MLRLGKPVRTPFRGLRLRISHLGQRSFRLEVWRTKVMPDRLGVYGPGVQPVAELSVDVPPRGASIVTNLWVDDSLRRKGIATHMHERAADMSCEQFGRPLGSDITRSRENDAFWRKQESRGRARCIRRSKRDPTWCSSYVLSCPAPKSLAAHGRRDA